MADFEKRLTDLEAVVDRLEQGDLPLDESVRLFEEGMKLSQSCKRDLDDAEGRIQVLLEQGGGKMKPQPLEVETDEEDEITEEEDEE
ncbi:MAG: exodeoxyribonuclease VII small subunit [Acidobacteria bacterium]|nr:exodeoxyribonuclease VII small subunit [Acidobacteriota bacterium]